MEKTFINATAIIDLGAKIEKGLQFGIGVIYVLVLKSIHLVTGQNVYIANKAIVGNFVKIQNNVSIFDNVSIEDEVFVAQAWFSPM